VPEDHLDRIVGSRDFEGNFATVAGLVVAVEPTRALAAAAARTSCCGSPTMRMATCDGR
jgi:hypothetical protein